MRNVLLLLTACIAILSCNVKEKPIFIAIEAIELVESTSKTVTLKADAIFQNPNDVSGALESDDISVFVNDIKVAQVSSEQFKVPAKKEFTIPLEVKMSTDSILKLKGTDAIGSLLNSLLNKKIKVQYKGDIIYKTFGFSYTYPIDETEMVNIEF
ncbi:LEA type 2 family protein [Psychroserpens algicola]|uniref:LEA type 2 family protein n=1 Tax=Psychroserpens algicola TaxID=1719034 RepID=A0ABT0H9R5_9FLAO|nr:LEA type 2 family protein [Psychroserpens algicola]MCK8481100.1 LEA type 2 family protein [Psychroserpens algicola]